MNLESRSDEEPNSMYEILLVEEIAENGGIKHKIMSINLQTGVIEEGTAQIREDKINYFNNLPWSDPLIVDSMNRDII